MYIILTKGGFDLRPVSIHFHIQTIVSGWIYKLEGKKKKNQTFESIRPEITCSAFQWGIPLKAKCFKEALWNYSVVLEAGGSKLNYFTSKLRWANCWSLLGALRGNTCIELLLGNLTWVLHKGIHSPAALNIWNKQARFHFPCQITSHPYG